MPKQEVHSAAYAALLKRRGRAKVLAEKRRHYRRHREQHKAKVYQWREANKAHHQATVRAYHKRKRNADPDWDYRWALKRHYGITIDDYYQMLIQQGNACAICREPFPPKAKRRPVVDHCHATNTVRGVLCLLCNVMLGSARDDVSILERAARYIRANAVDKAVS